MISLIVAVSENGVIGKNGSVPWHLPAELAHFKQTTMGHPVIMGRKTYESIGRPLPGRYNIVITRQKNYRAKGCVVVHSIDEAIARAKKAPGSEEIFIIGGSEIYNQTISLADRLYLSKVHTIIDGDTFFKFDSSRWKEVSRETRKADVNNQSDCDYIVLVRKNRKFKDSARADLKQLLR